MISSSSFRNRTCLSKLDHGQYLKVPLRMGGAVSLSFSAYWRMQSDSCWWYNPRN